MHPYIDRQADRQPARQTYIHTYMCTLCTYVQIRISSLPHGELLGSPELPVPAGKKRLKACEHQDPKACLGLANTKGCDLGGKMRIFARENTDLTRGNDDLTRPVI